MGLLALKHLMSMRRDRRRHRPIQGRSKPPLLSSLGRSIYSSLPMLCVHVLTYTTSAFGHRSVTCIVATSRLIYNNLSI
jgi:hypothetical protein